MGQELSTFFTRYLVYDRRVTILDGLRQRLEVSELQG